MTTELLGEVLGHHELVRVVGSGPKGLVYEAFDPRLGRRVAIKTFRLDGLAPSAADRFEARLRADAQAAAALQHPNIVAVHACDRQGSTASLAMEFVEGENLAQHLARVGKLPALQALALVAQMLSALEVAHGHGIAHGRIEPEHLLVSRTGRLKLAGFGVPHSAAADVQGDLFSAAAVAYQLLTGVLPFGRSDAGAPPAPHDLRPDLPRAVDGVFARALSRDPHARHRSAGELFAALRTAFDPPLWVRPDKAAAPRVLVEPQSVGPIQETSAAMVIEPSPPLVVESTAPVATEPAPLLAVEPRPVAVLAAAPRRRPARHGLRKRLALATACIAGLATVAALLVGGELSMPVADRGEPAPVVAAVEPAAMAPVATVAAVAPPAAPVEIIEPPDSPAAVVQAEPQQEAEPVRRDLAPEPAAPRLRSSPRLANDTRVAGAGPARQHAVSARRQAVSFERQPQRGGPDAACRHQQLLIAREICRVAECTKAELRSHPACVRMHAEQRMRDQLSEQALRTR